MLERFLTRPLLQFAALPFLVWNMATFVSWVAFPFTGLLIDGRPIGIDFQVFWTAARIALAGDPALVYDPLVMHQARELLIPGVIAPGPWLYPPSFLLMLLPLGLLPYFVALAVFMLSTVLGLVWVWRQTIPGCAGTFLLLASPALFGAGLMLLPRRPVWAGILVLGFDALLSISRWVTGNVGLLKLNNSVFAMSRIVGLSISEASLVHGLVTLALAVAALRVWTIKCPYNLRCAVLCWASARC